MLRYGPALIAALFSLSALAEVSMEEKRARVRMLETMSEAVPAIHLEGYRRELRYEERSLPLEERASHEANLMAEVIKSQVFRSYEKALADHQNVESAKAFVRDAIDRDLELAQPELREAIRDIAFRALDDVISGIYSVAEDSEVLRRHMLNEVTERANFLNGDSLKSLNTGADASRRTYSNKAELVSSLISSRDGALTGSVATSTMKSALMKRRDANISYSLKISFLGAELSGGPSISFRRQYESKVVIVSEGLTPAIASNGQFDLKKKTIVFNCEVSLAFSTEYSGGGSFSIAGIGGGASSERTYSNEVSLSSRSLRVPEYISNQTVTLPVLQRICMDDFLNAKVSNRMSVKESLNLQMRTMIASLRFSHPKTQCVRDSQCIRWFNQGMRGVVGNAAVPRCVEESREKFFACEVRAVVNQKCPVIKNKKLVSTGMFEYPCDRGLVCRTVKEAGWFQNMSLYQYAEGRCVPRR